MNIIENEVTESEYVLRFDGGSRGNPGRAASGAVIYQNGKEVRSHCILLGDHLTSNYAEYHGLILGLKMAIDMEIEELQIEGDSLLVIRQCNGDFKVKSQLLLPLHSEVRTLLENINSYKLTHIRRDKNKRADSLVNKALNLTHM